MVFARIAVERLERWSKMLIKVDDNTFINPEHVCSVKNSRHLNGYNVLVKMANGSEETFACYGSYADTLEAAYSLVAGLNKAEAEGFTVGEESEEE